MGFMPRIDSDSLYVTNDGLFQITLRAEELYDLLALVRFAIMLEEECATGLFEDRARPVFQRLSSASQEKFNPKFYAESIAKAFFANWEKQHKKLMDEATRKYRKQVSRLASQVPRGRPSRSFKGANPASDPADILKLLRHAIEHELPVKIDYIRSTGERIVEKIEPEGLQDKKVYAFCPDHDQHHIYATERIQSATL
jgi:predicted DNA-binding transcriptional regulator YafY